MTPAPPPAMGPLGTVPEVSLGLHNIWADGKKCNRCPLHETAKTTVVYRGDPKPVVLFIGQSPGGTEDEEGEPFVGPTRRQLEEKIGERPFPPHGFTNVVLHHPPKDRYRTEYGIACEPFLARTIKTLTPAVLVALGRDAEAALLRLELDIPKMEITHPAAMFHNPQMRVEWDAGWVKLHMWLRGHGVFT